MLTEETMQELIEIANRLDDQVETDGHSHLLSALIIANSNTELKKSIEYCMGQLSGAIEKSFKQLDDTIERNSY